MSNSKFIGVWTKGLAMKSPNLREEIEKAFNFAAKEKDDWFYKVSVDGEDYFIADNGEFGFTAMLPEEY